MEEDIRNVLVAGAANLDENQASSSSLVIPPQLRKEVQDTQLSSHLLCAVDTEQSSTTNQHV